ncbi:Mitogen-activated protein kinase kinase kinase 18 [Camellia lanceoleosa]|uniref:Mitogen-activated protein kinase kinase kinase 18 n=1 Tax=Camellia lanceoleosa TaxID=1840588 RepID=A0ACC0HIZ5_9ERIC|nr:Mitogen-activated protein kinase kinase kinase 18 [Camellia lanceoleosa]
MDWTRGHTIGRGSSATVSTATCQCSGDIFAVKSAELSDSEPLQREQKILSILSSPHVVSYIGHDITRESNKVFFNLSMEYVSGGTLTDVIRIHGGKLDESVIGFYTQQIVRGLEYIHSSGIAHCDIKGQNILIAESGAKIADFGCARWHGAVVPIGGTPMFMAPEVARGEEQGYPADIWALGCTVIEMATGGSPWPNVTNPVSVLYKIAFSSDLPEIPDFLSSQTKDFLGKCLRRDPKDRWTAKQLLKHPFFGESKLDQKQIPEFNSGSPTSILDQGIWSSMEETETHKGHLNSQGKLVGKLSLLSGKPNWTWDENWITIRSNENDGREICGSVTASNSDEMELESCDGGEEAMNFTDSKVSGSNNSSRSLMDCTCTEGRVVMSNLNFGREKGLLLIQSQFL